MKKINFFKAFLLMLPRFARVSPVLFVMFSIVGIVHAIARAALVPATQFFLERATDFTIQKAELSDVIAGLILLGLAHVGRQLIHGFHHMIIIPYYRKAEGVLDLEIHKKLSRISPLHFENTQTLDDINKAIKGKNEAVWFTGSILDAISFCIPYFIFMAVYLMNIKPILIILLALAFLPALLTHILRAKVFAKVEDKAAPIRREFDYYELCLTGREYFKETRVLGAFSYFKKIYVDALTLLNKLDFRASVKASSVELCASLLSLFGYIGTLLLLLELLLKGEISVGAFVAIFTSLELVFSLMRQLIFQNLGESAKNLSRVQNYLRFMQIPEREGAETELPIDSGIDLCGVSSSYLNTQNKSVDNVTVNIRYGETVAIVGENGSGKTTLVRMITGLYLPDEGEILYGDLNIKTVSAFSLYKNISAVFQKFQRYQMTLRENIGISNTDDEVSDTALDMISAQAGIDINTSIYINGYDTMLSREFDGTDLSGGQWQRVAIARSFFRTHQLIVLDEPTAAIDPIEETKIYNRFAEIAKDKTALIVTHRLGSVKLADRILVMKQGELVEQGTHAELLALKGEYSRLYLSQEQWYV